MEVLGRHCGALVTNGGGEAQSWEEVRAAESSKGASYPETFTTWRLMGSYKWGYKGPFKGPFKGSVGIL